MYIPLAEKYRPEKLEDVLGQDHLTAEGKIIAEIIKNKRPISLILWGPAGSGKTTLARIIAKESGAVFNEISAVTAGKPEVKKIIEDAKVNRRLGQITVLFVDEIHRFNKAQQDAFLPHVEDGTIILVGATTENPSFEVIGPLLSRSRVLVLESLSESVIENIIKKVAKSEGINSKRLPNSSVKMLAKLSGGDVRVALGNLEVALQLTSGPITSKTLEAITGDNFKRYDKSGEQHYNVISAFIKSMRGSDPTATVYYLARMLHAGEDPKFIARRMVVFASEDIGLVAPAALNLAVSTFLAVERVGMPECEHNLFHCAIVLAKADKSRAVVDAMYQAKQLANEYPNLQVPIHLRSKATRGRLAKSEIDESKKVNTTSYEDAFLPPEIQDTKII